MSRIIDLRGQRFGKLVVLSFAEKDKWGNWKFVCKCDCGKEKAVVSHSLRTNQTKSCGCMSSNATIGIRSTKHGFAPYGHPNSFYNRYCTMVDRINNPKNKKWKDYGGRGIKNTWGSFIEFRNDMYESYLQHVKDFGQKNTSIDRIDVNGHYQRSNCRWTTAKEQANNKR